VRQDGFVLGYDEIAALRERHPAWRLLRAQHAALVVSVLGRVFVEENVRSMPLADLVSRLDDELFALRLRLGEDAFPLDAPAYLTDWTDKGWLRKYYPPGTDDPHVDATPALERVVAWAESLAERTFVGTESRLATLVDLLRQIARGSDADPDRRLAQLYAERARLDAQIADAEAGHVEVLGDTALRERYQQFANGARELLADFREVEDKFRGLDRQMRETIASWDGSKGELLDRILGDRNLISESDQGRSFIAFYDLLLSSARQEELTDLLREVHQLAVVQPDPRVRRINHDWLGAADLTQSTVRHLSDQLRRFLDDRVWLENRRVMDLLRSIETTAVHLRDRSPTLHTELDGIGAAFALPTERPLYSPPTGVVIDSQLAETGDAADPDALFAQAYVDHERITDVVRTALAEHSQVELARLLEEHPLQQGLAELVAYFAFNDTGVGVDVDESTRGHVAWLGPDGVRRTADIPRVLYVRATERGPAP
jgi:hypothetical protein